MTTRKEAVAIIFSHVFTSPEEFAKNVATEHAIANMGQSLEDLISSPEWAVKRPQDAILNAWSQFASDAAGEGIDIEDERRSWKKEGEKTAKAVQKAGLPMTMENARLFFEKKGPFAKKTKK